MVLLAEPVLGKAECRGEFLERFALGALAYDEAAVASSVSRPSSATVTTRSVAGVSGLCVC